MKPKVDIKQRTVTMLSPKRSTYVVATATQFTLSNILKRVDPTVKPSVGVTLFTGSSQKKHLEPVLKGLL